MYEIVVIFGRILTKDFFKESDHNLTYMYLLQLWNILCYLGIRKKTFLSCFCKSSMSSGILLLKNIHEGKQCSKHVHYSDVHQSFFQLLVVTTEGFQPSHNIIVGLHGFFHHSDVLSSITFHIKQFSALAFFQVKCTC